MSRYQFFFTVVCCKRCFLIYLRPPSSVPKSKVEKSPAHVNRLGELQAFCEILAMYEDASLI